MKLNINFLYASKHRKKAFSFYIPKYMHELFDKYKKQLADHGRRSGVVALAGAGISMPNLKQAGRWASISAVEEYMEHSHASKKECPTLLDTKKKACFY
eukprot:1017079-Ditylum_brightwellii.AAC.1